ncbi:MAG: hypothetical protein EHM13_00200 [Acidobacteria bacterium]|nr:MAG: hypothetical protein EHM13_00200 [Acidobacteriota bacterium]
MWKATVVRSWNEAETGGPVAGNAGMEYTVDEDDATLASLGLTRQEVDETLDYMNARANIVPNRAARLHVDQWGTPTGRIRRPVLTMHYKHDGMAFVTNESYYKALIEGAGNGHRLVQTYVNGPAGHCSFTPDQYRSVLGAMESWLNTGVAPDASFFPATKGFNLTFSPGRWIF